MCFNIAYSPTGLYANEKNAQFFESASGGWHIQKVVDGGGSRKEIEDNGSTGFYPEEKVSSDDRLKKVLPTSYTVEMKEQVERHITLLEKRLTAGIGAEELEIFSDVLKKMQENMELTEKGAGYG